MKCPHTIKRLTTTLLVPSLTASWRHAPFPRQISGRTSRAPTAKKQNTEKFSKVLVIVTFFDKYSGVLNLENLKIESGEF